MKFAMIAFSREGAGVLKRLCTALGRQGEICEGFVAEKYRDPEDPVTVKTLTASAGEWAGEQFTKSDCLVFVGAVGIAVRSFAPYINDKFRDPAVVVVDDSAHFAISLLSGHAGGANDLTRRIARILDATPVITTSSDLHGICALDEWAAKLGLTVTDTRLAKEAASLILDGDRLRFYEDELCEGYCSFKAQAAEISSMPDGCDETAGNSPAVYVTPRRKIRPEGEVLRLLPRCIAVGVGCRKGIEVSVILDVIYRVLERENLDRGSVFCLASVDLKNREPGIVAAAQAFSVPFATFPSAFLDAIPGSFSESEFVRKVTGTGNVCERAAFAASLRKEDHLPAKLLTGKYSENGVTVAVAAPDYSGSR